MAKNKIDVDTSKLSYDPNSKDFIVKLETDFPSFKEFTMDASTRFKIFSWIVLMFDINSPMRIDSRDYYERKVKSAVIVGLNPNKKTGEYKTLIEDILLGKDKDVNRLCVDYIVSFSSPEYTQLMGLLVVQRNHMMDLMKGTYDANTTKVLDQVANRISELTKRIYHSGDRIEVEEARKALYYQAGEDLNKLRPESIAAMLDEDGGLPVEWGIYDDGYVPEPITFDGDDPLIAINDED